MARVTMLAMHKDGLLVTAAAQVAERPPRRPKPIAFGPGHRTAGCSRRRPPSMTVRPLEIRTVVHSYSREGKLWNEFVAR